MELATLQRGARVLCGSSFDCDHPPEFILEGDESKFWMTTGSYPQEFVLQLGAAAQISRIKLYTSNVKRLRIERCEGLQAVNWEKVFESDVDENDGRIQVETCNVKTTASFLKFKIVSAYNDFVSVHKVSVEGRSDVGA